VIISSGPQFAALYEALDNSEQLLVSKSLDRLEKAKEPIGKLLRGGLASCRSIRTGHNSRLRIVYRPIEETAELIAVGQRKGSVVYIIALEILEN
jgi:mRNA-degrading endonuclease RelE of RelBE toxin-antitoxin system